MNITMILIAIEIPQIVLIDIGVIQLTIQATKKPGEKKIRIDSIIRKQPIPLISSYKSLIITNFVFVNLAVLLAIIDRKRNVD